jgi:molecular chaperone DnaK (HSP70)
MTTMDPRFVIGIDLGTTNCAVAYVDRAARQRAVQVFAIPQLIAPGELRPRALLPSFLYLPGSHELAPDSTRLPWDGARRYAVGEFARAQGARVPGRLVSSAKSWLCHHGVNRTAAILPWAGSSDVDKVSPVDASARYLQHIREAWNATRAAGESSRFEQQDVVLTVPASFDEVARDLTVDAARAAGIERLTLLEEPQAAFYAWLDEHAHDWSRFVQVGDVILVCDVGGGTTDFSLMAVDEIDGQLGFRRLAVGAHLMLGGDNMDVALARALESRLLGRPGKLDAVQWAGLVQACRNAKETLLAADAPPRVPVGVAGRGSRLIGDRLQAELTRDELLRVVLDGFLPATRGDDEPIRQAGTGLQEFGLPYVSDPALPKYLSQFLRRHRVPRRDAATNDLTRPDAILFNGGAFTPALLRDRLVEVLASWFGDVPGWRPRVLATDSLDLAVARGAAAYGRIRRDGGVRIHGGTARTYYVGIEAPGSAQPMAVCIVPRGLQEGEELTIADGEFQLLVGKPVRFPIYSSTFRNDDQPGMLIPVDDRQMDPLPPVETTLRAGSKTSAVKTVPVSLLARFTEVGTIELWCAARHDNRRWRLQFQIRSHASAAAPVAEAVREGGSAADSAETLDETVVEQAVDLVWRAFAESAAAGGAGGPTPGTIMGLLRDTIGLNRDAWPTPLLRRLWEPVCAAAGYRAISPSHDGRWSHLAGYCLRPGCGFPNDDFRVQQLWRAAHDGPACPRDDQARIPWWIVWRRVAAGLSQAYQEHLHNRLVAVLLPGRSGGRRPSGPRPGTQELAEMWRVAGCLDRIAETAKRQFAEALLKQLRRPPLAAHLLWSLARIGARVPLFGPLNTVVHVDLVQSWLDQLLTTVSADQVAAVAGEYRLALSSLARRTGDRHRDIDESLRDRVIERLRAVAASEHCVRLVAELSELDSEEQRAVFGDSLPAGLRLIGSDSPGQPQT